LLEISRQSVYQAELRIKARAKELEIVKQLVLAIRMKMPRIGTRKLYYLLKQELDSLHIKIGRDALFNYLKTQNMLIKPKKNYTKTTDSKHWLRKHPNLLKEETITHIEQVFVSDITYLKTSNKTVYLSLVTDAFSRKIMGYHLSKNMNTENVAKALEMAIKNKQTQNTTIHHSDRGLQYCASYYQNIIQNNNMTPSMTDGYDCYQNALAERINGILKQEFLLYKTNTIDELRKLVKQSIEIYNNDRPHLALNMKTPQYIHNKKPQELALVV
jgi:transposase InsO family protein